MANCCNTENNPENLPDISFGYNIQAALTAHALIQQARDRALNQWFDKQHTVLKNEIEKQLFKSFTSYNEARNTYFKHFEAEVTRKHSRPISDKYQSRYLDKANSKSISINNLKLLQLRENELKVGNINNSSYANFTFNGTPINQIKSITQLQTLWNNELTSFSNAYSGYHNDYYTYLKIRQVSSDTDYNNPYILELLNKQLANYNQYDRWQQLNLMQSYLNKIVPPLALPSGYINPKIFASPEYIENYALKNRDGGVSVFDDAYIDVIFGQIVNSGVANTLPGGLQQAHYIAKGRTENLRKEELNKLLGQVNEESLILQQFNNSQTQLETLYNDNKIRLKPNIGKINNRDDQKYTHFGTDGVYGVYIMEDGSRVMSSPTQLSLNATGQLVAQFTAEIGNSHYWYIKLEGSNEWANYLLKSSTSLADELRTTALLSAQALGKAIGKYVLPVEDIKILLSGTDFEGQQVSRYQAGGFLLLTIVPGSKALKIVGNAADAVKVVVKLGSNNLVVDTVKTGLKIVTDNNIVKFLSQTGNEIARIVNGVMTFKYAGFGGNIITNPNKTTTLIGKWEGYLDKIWETGLAKHGSNKGGLNILGEPFGSNVAEIWANNKTWLDRAISRGDIIRATANPLDINNVFHIKIGIDPTKFTDINTLKNYLLNLTPEKVEQLGYYGREIRHLFQNGYIFNSTTKQFIK